MCREVREDILNSAQEGLHTDENKEITSIMNLNMRHHITIYSVFLDIMDLMFFFTFKQLYLFITKSKFHIKNQIY